MDAPGGYRNGYGKERRLTLSCGTIKLRRPRVRDLEERFESRVLPRKGFFIRRHYKAHLANCLPSERERYET